MLPYAFKWCLQRLLPYSRKVFGQNAYVALQRLLPQVRKNMSTILTIFSVMVILMFSTATMKSIATSGVQYIDEKFETEVYGTYDLANITGEQTVELIDTIEKLDGVRDVYANSGIAPFTIQLPSHAIYTTIQATNLENQEQSFPLSGA